MSRDAPSLRRQIDRWYAGAGTVLVLLIGVSCLWLFRTGRETAARIESLSRSQSLVSTFQRTVLRELEVGQRYLIAPDPALEERFNALGREAFSLQEEILASTTGSPEMVAALATIQRYLSLAEASLARAHRLADLDRPIEVQEALSRTSEHVDVLLAGLERQEAARRIEQEDTLQRLESQALRVAVSILLTLLVGFGIALWAARRLLNRVVRSVADLATHAGHLQRGELTVHTDTSTLPAELGVLGSALNEASRSLEELAEKERALHRAEKLSTMGLLVSGIAHELNNPLATILLTSEELLEGGVEGSPALISTIHAQANRARAIVRQLLITVREDDTPQGDVDVGVALRRVRSAFEPVPGDRGVDLRWELPEALPVVRGGSTGLEMAVTNLVENAIEASGPGGEVAVRARQDEGRITIEVDDSGPGIGPELRSRIFDPFFTTRADEGRAGLGLSVARGVIRSMGGHLTQEDRPAGEGHGARFRISIPTGVGEASSPPASSEADRPEPSCAPAVSRERHILVVDDEEALRKTLKRIFERHGWEVTVACHGREALERVAESDFSVILTDLKMPVMTGMELVDRLLSMDAGIGARVVIMTGEHVAPGPSDFVERAPFPVVEKPFTVDEILRVATEVLSAGEASR